LDDIKIVELYWARSEDAIIETGIKYGRLCRHIVRNILANAQDEEECVNDTYLVDENVPLKLKIEPAGVEDEIIWLSSDEHIFTVTSDEVDAIKAKVTGINRGRATLTVSVGGINVDCIVRVK